MSAAHLRKQISAGVLAVAAGALLCAVAASPAAATGFGVERFQAPITEADGAPTTQAGSHPYALTTAIVFNTYYSKEYQGNGGNGLLPVGNPKDIEVNLPAGVVVNPEATPTRCNEKELTKAEAGESPCPESSAVGVLTVDFGDFLGEVKSPVYNMVAPPGAPAELGSAPAELGIIVHILGGVRTGSDYGLSGAVANLTEFQEVYGATLTLWGDPSAESHDIDRGVCAANEAKASGRLCPLEERVERPFLTLPGSCPGTPLLTTMSAVSWQEPANAVGASYEGSVVRGCERLGFTPSISVQPEKTVTDSPTGLSVDLHVPQSERVEGLAEANLEDATVTLPRGMMVNPSGANGLTGCPAGVEGFGLTSVPGRSPITTNAAPGKCPEDSKIGTVEVVTPLLEKPLTGAVYIAQQGNAGPAQGVNPFNSLLALYIVAEGSGVVVKLAGEVQADPVTGQLTTTFLNNPQLPFEDFKLDFFGGQRAPLVTPRQCGGYATATSLTPWSGTGAVSAPSSFTIDEGCTGGGGFRPSFTAGSVNDQAGASSPFAVTLSRQDGEQTLGSVAVTMPPGLLGMISKVTQCPEDQAEAGDCPASSQIGHVTSVAGAGADPVVLPEAGRREDPVYLTGPYGGGPFGLAIVVHPEAGPFNLEEGHPVIVRAGIHVDRHTAQVSVDSTPIPTILQGIPLDVRAVDVEIDRSGFMLNPTDCEPLSLTGTIDSSSGARQAVSSPFQAANCAALPFGPGFAVSTGASHSRADGDSLHVTVTSGSGQANIAKVHVELPKALPSRLSTLKVACPEAQFAKNPAGCPAGSFVGTATAHTPVLSKPMSGPAIFVSHGGAGFPDLDLVLQGEGVTVILTGNTDIKKGITISDFKTVPDVPVSRFDLVLPAGEHSALAAEGNLCYRTVIKRKRIEVRRHGHRAHVTVKVRYVVARNLLMPTVITGQNGAVVAKRTKIKVAGCARAKKKRKDQRRRGRKKRRK